jgi:hypothetical protein
MKAISQNIVYRLGENNKITNSTKTNSTKTHMPIPLTTKKTQKNRQIDAITVQFPAKFICGTAERQMLPLILC